MFDSFELARCALTEPTKKIQKVRFSNFLAKEIDAFVLNVNHHFDVIVRTEILNNRI